MTQSKPKTKASPLTRRQKAGVIAGIYLAYAAVGLVARMTTPEPPDILAGDDAELFARAHDREAFDKCYAEKEGDVSCVKLAPWEAKHRCAVVDDDSEFKTRTPVRFLGRSFALKHGLMKQRLVCVPEHGLTWPGYECDTPKDPPDYSQIGECRPVSAPRKPAPGKAPAP